jgi:hypothetical protein
VQAASPKPGGTGAANDAIPKKPIQRLFWNDTAFRICASFGSVGLKKFSATSAKRLSY